MRKVFLKSFPGMKGGNWGWPLDASSLQKAEFFLKCSRRRREAAGVTFQERLDAALVSCKTRWEEGEEAGREMGCSPQGWKPPWAEKEPAEGPGRPLCCVLTQSSGFLSASDPERFRD